MKKVILVFDGQHFSEALFNFALELHKKTPISITGVFLSAVDYSTILAYPMMTGALEGYLPFLEEDETVIKQNISRFETLCSKNDIFFRVHDNANGSVFDEIKKETRFADLMLISNELFYQNIGNQPNDYLQEVLHIAECPVMIVPENFQFPQNLILTYDGSASSVFAIKQFSYLFPELCNMKTILVYATDDEKDIPYQYYIEELSVRHFKDLTLNKVSADPQKFFTTWLNEQKNPLLITGSYGRSGLSQFFKKSFVHEVIKEHTTPVFIAHLP